MAGSDCEAKQAGSWQTRDLSHISLNSLAVDIFFRIITKLTSFFVVSTLCKLQTYNLKLCKLQTHKLTGKPYNTSCFTSKSMPRIMVVDQDEGGSSGPIAQEDHGIIMEDTVAIEATRSTRRNATSSISCLLAKCHDPRELAWGTLCLTAVAGLRSQDVRNDKVENATAPLTTPPVQLSSVAAIPALAVMLSVFSLVKQQSAEKGAMQHSPRSRTDLTPCHARKSSSVPTQPSSGTRRRRKRTKTKKLRAAAAKRAARRLGALERARVGCQERADTEPKHTMRVEKYPEGEQPEVAKGSELVKETEGMDEDAASTVEAALALELPFPSKTKRAERKAAAEGGGAWFPAQLMQKLWGWIAGRRVGAVDNERTGGGGGGDKVPAGRGRGTTTASQGQGCAKVPHLVEEEQEETAEASPATTTASALELPSPRESKGMEGTLDAVEGVATGQHGEASFVGVESEGGKRACRLSSGVELLSPAESSIIRTSFFLELEEELRARIADMGGDVVTERAGGSGGDGVSGRAPGQTTTSQGEGCANGPALVEVEKEATEASPAIFAASTLELPSPRRGKRAEETGHAVRESGTAQGEEAGLVGVESDVESDGSSRTCRLSSGFELLSPAESGIIRTRFPLELEEELRAMIAGRGGGEVAVEAVGEGAVEAVSVPGWGQPEQEAGALVPSMCGSRSRRPGDLKTVFMRNLRKVKESGSFEGVCAVRAAQIGLLEGRQLEGADVLGEGGFGTVWAVRHAVLPGEFALKTLREGAGERGRISAMVEMAVLARLSLVPHPNVISAVAIDDSQTSTMPILLPKAKGDFHTVLTSCHWPISELLRIVVQVAAGAEHMHKHGISHGDIKPQNVLMIGGKDGSLVPQLADFGTARELGESRPKMMGTVGYMPLECMLEAVPTSASQDAWALGVMALIICAAPDKVQSNMFNHEDLYTDRERACRSFLQTRGSPSEIADKLRSFECTVTMRTLADESYLKMLEPQNLHADLGCRDTVSDCLPYFLAKLPENRCDVEVFQKVVGNIAREVAEYEAGLEACSDQSSELSENEHESEDGDISRACL